MEHLAIDTPGAKRVVYLIAALLVVVAQAAILRTARAYVKAPASPDQRPTPWLEAFWAVAPVAALAAILLAAWRAT